MRQKIGVIRTTTASQNDHYVDFTSMILRTVNIGGYCELQIEEGPMCDGTTLDVLTLIVWYWSSENGVTEGDG